MALKERIKAAKDTYEDDIGKQFKESNKQYIEKSQNLKQKRYI